MTRIEVDVASDETGPTSQRQELDGLHRINGRTPVRHTEPWSVVRVGLRGWGDNAREELGQCVDTTRTKTGAVRIANKLAKQVQRSTRTTAYVVQCDGSDSVWHRAEAVTS